MKKTFMIFAAFVIFSASAYCDIYLMWGGDIGGESQGGPYTGTFFDTQYYPFDGPIGLGLDLKVRWPFTSIDYKYQKKKDYSNKIETVQSYDGGFGIDLIAAPTLSLRLFQNRNDGKGLRPVLKFFPVFAYATHPEFHFLRPIDQPKKEWKYVSELYIGGGFEACLNRTGNPFPTRGTEFFLTFDYGKLMETKETYFSIGVGIRGFFRKSLRDEKTMMKLELEAAQERKQLLEQEEKRRQEVFQQLERERLQRMQERTAAEESALQSGSLREMINFVNQYGDSKNIRIAIERLLSENKNQSYKELTYYENPYSFERGSVYYCRSLTVYQWVSEHSFLAKTNDNSIIYIETANIGRVTNTISYAFLKSNGVMEYSARAGLQIVPKFTLMIFK